ncbi:MAG TPA: sensor histidine kinase, partial [Bacilli bacterium]
DVPKPALVDVPGIWSDYRINGRRLSNQGYATYRIVIHLSETDAHRALSLYMPSVATAYRLWINGKEAAVNGVVGENKERMIPRNVAQIVPIRASGTTLELVLQVSNFVQRKGGLWQNIQLGESDQIAHDRELRLTTTLVFFTGLFVMGLYHLFLFLPRRSDRGPLYFACLCFSVGIRALFVGDTYAVHFFPAIPWDLATKTEYISANSAAFFLIAFIHSQFPRELPRLLRNLLLSGEGVFIGFVVVFPAIVYTKAMIVQELLLISDLSVVMAVLALAIVRKREGALIHLCGLVIIFFAVLNDILMYERLIRSVDLSPLGMFAYLFAQSVNISLKFSRSFVRIESLSAELRRVNLTLEDSIRERTEELVQANANLNEANARLKQIEESRRRLLANITHDMGNPLASLRGYLQVIEDGLARQDSAKYFQVMRDKVEYLDHMIQDLFELARLESRQIQFHCESVRLVTFIRQLCNKYELDLTAKGIGFIFALNELEAAAAMSDPLVRIDPKRIEQVFVNLLYNAAKFTPAEGTITVQCEADDAGVTVSVRDTGPGIAESELPHVFERFYRGELHAEAGEGLGLAIAKEIIERHDGKIGVESAVGAGSTFYFRLPVHHPEGEIGAKRTV